MGMTVGRKVDPLVPRAQPVGINNEFHLLIAGCLLRHWVKSGIIGWAQINGYRGDMCDLDLARKRIEHDLYYIQHWSVWFDLFIVVGTVVRGVFSSRAY